MATKREREARVELARDLKSVQDDLLENWISQSLPEDWNGLLTQIPTDKAEITLTLDDDMLKWFKRQASGGGVNWLINRVLRVYWQGIQSGDVRGHIEHAYLNPRRDRYLEALFVHRFDRMRAAGLPDEDETLMRDMLHEVRRVHKRADPLRELADARSALETSSG
ncbi:MAG: hypothetical protein AAF393_18165 [Pseudomonadota bacterium]